MTHDTLLTRSTELANAYIPQGENWSWTTRAEVVRTMSAKIATLAMEFSRETLQEMSERLSAERSPR